MFEVESHEILRDWAHGSLNKFQSACVRAHRADDTSAHAVLQGWLDVASTAPLDEAFGALLAAGFATPLYVSGEFNPTNTANPML
jgi:hypothetical protein